MKKILFISNIPAPYRIEFYNELGKNTDLTVLFEAKRAKGMRFNYNLDQISNFHAVFLSDGEMDERRVDWKILPFLRRGVYDKIVVTNYGFATEAAAILALKLRNIPYEMEIDGGILRREHPVAHALKRVLIRGAARYWSTGRQTDEFFRHFGVPAERIVRYPFTSVPERDVAQRAPTHEEKLALRKKLDIPYEHMVLGVGQMIHRKGFDLLIRAAANLPGSTGVYLVGGSPPEEWTRLISQLGLKNIHFVSFAGGALLTNYYRAADVFALPTREDVWGLVVNEAMANALPVVTTEGCAAGCEMIAGGENGFLVPVETVEPIAQRIAQLLEDGDLRARMSAAALETARRYTIEEMARVHLQAFSRD